ncbi:MAG: hypothetical protein DLM61_16600 [Pseudonocardiales bacterium]|nr:MAG: hypothetical protein DLM61_16600 [Pseudonocardiales bacterium]
MAGSFEHSGAQLAGVAQQQNSLAAAVAAGELWLETGVAERAAARCEQAVREIDGLPPATGPAPDLLYPATGAAGEAAVGGAATGRSGTRGPVTGRPGGGSLPGGAHVAYQPPTPATLQGVSSGPVSQQDGQMPPDQPVRRTQNVGGQVAAAAAAAAGVPIMAPNVDSRIRRALAPGVGVRLGGGGAGGGHLSSEGQLSGRASTANTVEFGPRPAGAIAEAAEGRMGRGAGAGDLVAPMGAAGGKRGEDSEHRRPSYLIEMDDIFTDARKVAPAVIGADPPEQDR